MSITASKKEQSQSTDLEFWFDDFVAQLRVHQVALETDTATSELKKFYNTAISGTSDELAQLTKSLLQKHYISRILFDYLESTKSLGTKKVAFDYDDSKVLIWVEIGDDEDDLEAALILANAKINATYHKVGYDAELTIVEERDGLSTPSHYKVFKQ